MLAGIRERQEGALRAAGGSPPQTAFRGRRVYLYLPKLIRREAVLAGQAHITAGIQCRRQCRCRSAASPSQTQCGRRFDGTEERVSADFFKNSIETAGLEAASSGPIFDHARGCGTAPCRIAVYTVTMALNNR